MPKRDYEAIESLTGKMLAKLRANEQRGAWYQLSYGELIRQANKAKMELSEAIYEARPDEIQHHAITVANYMLMIADNARINQ